MLERSTGGLPNADRKCLRQDCRPRDGASGVAPGIPIGSHLRGKGGPHGFPLEYRSVTLRNLA